MTFVRLRLAIFGFLILPARLWIHLSALLVGARFIEEPIKAQHSKLTKGNQRNGSR